MNNKTKFLLLGFMIAVVACAPVTPVPTVISEPTAAIQSTVISLPTQTPATPGLTLEGLKNSVYYAPQYQKTIQLTDGKYEITDSSGAYSVTLLPEAAIGDLNGDRVADAALLLAENGGGTGVFVSLILIISDGGHYYQAGEKFIDDRPVIHSVEIVNSEVIVDAVIHGVNDAMIAPTFSVKESYRLLGQTVTLVRLTSKIADGGERSITIDTPIDGSAVENTTSIAGKMPIAPFENNLSFRVYDLTGNELATTGFVVNAAEPGAPATFDTQLSLPVLPAGSLVRLELSELSMADGSVLCMDSVVVAIK